MFLRLNAAGQVRPRKVVLQLRTSFTLHLNLLINSTLNRARCNRLLDCSAEEYFHRRHPVPNNHTQRNAIDDYGEPVSNQKRWLAGFVSQMDLSDQGTGPSPDEAHHMQSRFRGSPSYVLSSLLVPRVAAIRDHAGNIIESQPTHLEPSQYRECG